MASTNFKVKNGLDISGTLVVSNGVGSNGQVLASTGTGVQWVNASSSSGDVVGPASSTDNAVVRFDSTTGKLIQNSTVILSDGGILTVPEVSTASITSTGNSHITIAPDGTGDLHVNADSMRLGDNASDATFASRNGDLIITTNEGSGAEGIVRLYDGANGNITLTPNGTGQVQVGTDQVVTLTASQTLTNKTLTSPILTTPALGTPASGTLTNCTFPTLNQNTTGSAGSVANTLTISSPLTGTSFNGSAAVSIGIPVATTSANGYLSSTDWTTFNNKGSGSVISVTGGTYLTGGTITTTGTLAVDATSANTASKVVARDASGNFSAGTITASLSGNATNVTGTVAVANGGTSLTTLTSGSYVVGAGTSAVTLKTPTQVTADLDTFTYQLGATAGKKGLVPAAPAVGASVVYLDQTGAWTTPSAGGTTTNALTISSPLTGTSFNGSSAVSIGIPVATTSANGYLSSTDWTTFNNKGSGTVTSIGSTTLTTGGTSAVPTVNLTSGIVTAGTTGSASLIPVVTVDTYGRVTTITTAANPQGTVTSVTGTSPVASSGGTTPVISLNSSYGDTQNPYASKTANYVLAAPNGSAGVPTFRAIVAADIPTLNQNTTGSSGSCTGNSATATSAATLTTARTINTTSFNGSADITIGSKSNIGTPSSAGTNYYGTIYVTQTASPTGGSTGDLYLVY